MNLQKLFEAQKKLDDHIRKEKGLEGQDLLDKKVLALQVELGELANEWQMFKFWKDNPKPNRGRLIGIECGWCEGSGWEPGSLSESCQDCNGTGEVGKTRTNDPLLEEYVDCLHFILSIGLELETTNIVVDSDYMGFNATETFIIVFETIVELANSIREGNKSYIYQVYEELFNLFVGLGEKYLGFTWQEVEQAYYKKNEINHERQENGY